MRYTPLVSAGVVCALAVGAGLMSTGGSGRKPAEGITKGAPVDVECAAETSDTLRYPPKPADSEEVRIDDCVMIPEASMTEIKTKWKDVDAQVGLWPGAPGWVMRFVRKQMKQDLESHEKTLRELDPNGVYDHDDYTFRAVPVWMDKDGDMVTFSFLRRREGAFMHPMEYEYFLTFRLSDGRVLDHADFWRDNEFDGWIRRLDKALSYWAESDCDAAIHIYDQCTGEFLSSPEGIMKIIYKGKMYPRPARTGNGYIFSYQILEKGSRSFGIVHFLLYL